MWAPLLGLWALDLIALCVLSLWIDSRPMPSPISPCPPEIGPIVAEARRLGSMVSIITNGFRLDRLLGRAEGDHVAHSIALAARTEGPNDGSVEDLLIPSSQFDAFVDRHRPLAVGDLGPIVEDNDAMTGSYLMIAPIGRFYCNTAGRHTYSDLILAVGVAAAAAAQVMTPRKFP